MCDLDHPVLAGAEKPDNETNNKYTKYLNICAHFFNVVATII
jgi:hypothetical protein